MASIWDTLTGKTASGASNASAADTYAKQQQATGQLKKAGQAYDARLTGLSDLFRPYAEAGGDALDMYRAGLGLDGGAGSARFTEAYRAIPGYDAGLKTGTDSAVAGLNASGRLNSGGAMKALQRYGSDYEDQRSSDYLARLLGLTQTGQQATGQQVSTAAEGARGNLGARTTAYGGDMVSAGTIGQGMVAGANAEQGAWGNLLGTAAYLGGAALGGPVGSAVGGTFTNLFKQQPAQQRQTSFASPWAGGIPQKSGLNGYGGAYG
jgi:hypothetical protein